MDDTPTGYEVTELAGGRGYQAAHHGNIWFGPIRASKDEACADAQIRSAIESAGRQIAEKEAEIQRMRDSLGELRTAVRREDTAVLYRHLGPNTTNTLADFGSYAREVLEVARRLSGSECG